MVAFNEAGQRIDSIRGNFDFNPFLVRPSDGKITIQFLFVDILPDGSTAFGNVLAYNKLRISNDLFEFKNANELDLTIPIVPDFYSLAFSQPIPQNVPYYQTVTFDPADFGYGVGDIVYLRAYVQDSDHSEPTEIPSSSTQYAIQTYFSFVIQ